MNETQNSIQKNNNSKKHDLEERSFEFARRCRGFVKKLHKTISNIEYRKQLIRSYGSQAANYIEANKSLSKKDFHHRVKICRKEAKESLLWMRLCDVGDNQSSKKEQPDLIREAKELTKIFGSQL